MITIALQIDFCGCAQVEILKTSRRQIRLFRKDSVGPNEFSLDNRADCEPDVGDAGGAGLLFLAGGFVRGSDRICWRFLRGYADRRRRVQNAGAKYDSGGE